MAPAPSPIAPIAEPAATPGGLELFVPPVSAVTTAADEAFMAFSTCSAADFRHPAFADLCRTMHVEPIFHRKLWEHVYILHHLTEQGMVAAGRRGIGFGVGSEPLPAVFAAAGCQITATDAPPAIGYGSGWNETKEYSATIDGLRRPDICDDATLDAAVEHRFADMNDIPSELTGYDFCWSACCFEHLGSLRHGADFVVETVERVLRPGGVAVHTTEFNLSSDTDTFESEAMSIYRRRDILEQIERLRALGHDVEELRVAPDAFYLDHYVDLPPYRQRLHLKLELAGHVATSVGLVIRRGDR